MSIASRYGQSLQESEEIANDGFYKMLTRLDQYQSHIPFELWLRRIIINCGIDHYRKYHKNIDLIDVPEQKINRNSAVEKLESEYLLECIRALSPVYRMVFTLFAIEGFSHEEIAEQLQISVGASKSNLHKARKKLQLMIRDISQENSNYGG